MRSEMKWEKYEFQKKVRGTFWLGVFCVAGLLGTFFFFLYRISQNQQLIFSLNNNYGQNYEGIESIMERAEVLVRQLSVGSMLDMQQVLQKDSVAEEISQFDELTEYTDSLEYAMGNVDICYYISDDFSIVHEEGMHYRPIGSIKEYGWYKKVADNNGRAVWFVEEHDARLSIARWIADSKNYLNNIGMLVISLDTDSISRELVEIAEGQVIYLEDGEGNIITFNQGETGQCIRLPEDKRYQVMGEYEECAIEGGKYLARRAQVDSKGIYLVSIVPYGYLNNNIQGFIVWTVMSYGFVLAFVAVYITLASKKLTVPLTMLTQAITDATESGNLKEIAIDSVGNEIQLLLKAYNTLTRRIESLLREQYLLGEEKMKAELKALQSQINPHFLYNTLDMVNWMAERNEQENIQQVIQKISMFYRLVLSKGKDIITLEEEILLCETYVSIQQMRFRGRINFVEDVSKDILSYPIPKITLQPLIENAIVHGINACPEGRGMITLHGWMEDGRIILAVTDDGAGMGGKESLDKEEEKGSHYGMKNIQTRLSVFYKEKIEFEIESTMGIGTCVSINIPAFAGGQTYEET